MFTYTEVVMSMVRKSRNGRNQEMGVLEQDMNEKWSLALLAHAWNFFSAPVPVNPASSTELQWIL